MIKAVVFDLDGVLIDSESLKTFAYDRALKKLFGKGIPSGKDRQPGESEKFNARLLMEMIEVQGDIEELIQEKRTVYDEIAEKEIKLCAGVQNFLKATQQRKLSMVVATASNRKSTDRILEKLDLAKYFNFVLTGDDVKEHKPDPEVYFKAVQELGMKKDECLVIEDSPAGITAAKAAGLKCVAITHTFPKEELKQADLIVDSFKEIDYTSISL